MLENSLLTVAATILYCVALVGAAIYGLELSSLTKTLKRIWKRK